MPQASPTDLRAAVAQRKPAPVYLILGDDEAEMSHLVADLGSLVEDELRVFNSDRLYAGEKSTTPAVIVEACRLIPMLGDRRVVVVLRAERLLKPKRRGKAAGPVDDGEEPTEGVSDLDALTEYVQAPVPSTTLILVSTDLDKTRRIGKALLKHATVVECWGLKNEKNPRYIDFRATLRKAEEMVRRMVAEAGQQIEPSAARLVAERAGVDIVRLRGDVERLKLYAAGKATITLADAQEVVSAETAQDDWAVTNAIGQRNHAEALRQLSLAIDAGAVPYMILGQLAWFVRDKLANIDVRRVPAAVDALFRADLDLKRSGGEPKVLLERLVVELCGGR
ncbi:MAG TPA: DNA polymerase III subunit delta [Vicinamibacterales bacterium]|jgi:DNA polymerase-3 subunit delta